VTSAALDDGSHAWRVLEKLLPANYPRLRLVWADNKYHNKKLQRWLKEQQVNYEIEVVLPRHETCSNRSWGMRPRHPKTEANHANPVAGRPPALR
jgi:hypothetical protein